MHNPNLSRSTQSWLLALAIVALGAVAAESAHAQVSDTIVVDTDANTTHPATRCKTLSQSGVGTVEVCATVSKAAGVPGKVDLTVTRKSLSLWGETQITGFIQCGTNSSGQKVIAHFNIRPTVWSPWRGMTQCPNSLSPVGFHGDIAMVPL